MQYYHFDRSTGEFLGAFNAQIDPLETQRQGKVVYCLPGLSDTKTPPPSTDQGVVAVWTGAAWDTVQDHRGETWWDGSSEVTITEIGDPSEQGLSATPPAPEPPSPTVENIKAECSRRIFAIANSNAQMNMASFAAAGVFNASQMAAYTAGLQWIAAMRAKCAVLIVNSDPAFAEDSSWPACPAAAAALAAQF